MVIEANLRRQKNIWEIQGDHLVQDSKEKEDGS